MADARQPIYNAMNWLGSAIPSRMPEDDLLVIDAYSQIVKIQDRASQDIFVQLVERLRLRDDAIKRIMKAWENSSEQLSIACQLIGEPKKTAKLKTE